MTNTLKMLKTLYALALILRQTHQWKLRLVAALVRLQALLLDFLQEFGITQANYPQKSRMFIVPVFGVFCCTAAKRVPCQMYRRKLTPSTNDVSGVFSELGGNTISSTKKC